MAERDQAKPPTHRVYSVIKREGQDDFWLNLGSDLFNQPTGMCLYFRNQNDVTVGAVYLEQLQTYADPRHDPRGWIPTVAYLALIDAAVLRADESSATKAV